MAAGSPASCCAIPASRSARAWACGTSSAGRGLLRLGRVSEGIGDPAVGEVDGGQRGEQVSGEVGQSVLPALLQPAFQVLARQVVVPGEAVTVAQALQRRDHPLRVVDLLGQAQRPPAPLERVVQPALLHRDPGEVGEHDALAVAVPGLLEDLERLLRGRPGPPPGGPSS